MSTMQSIEGCLFCFPRTWGSDHAGTSVWIGRPSPFSHCWSGRKSRANVIVIVIVNLIVAVAVIEKRGPGRSRSSAERFAKRMEWTFGASARYR